MKRLWKTFMKNIYILEYFEKTTKNLWKLLTSIPVSENLIKATKFRGFESKIWEIEIIIKRKLNFEQFWAWFYPEISLRKVSLPTKVSLNLWTVHFIIEFIALIGFAVHIPPKTQQNNINIRNKKKKHEKTFFFESHKYNFAIVLCLFAV